MNLADIGLPLLRRLDPERAHRLALAGLRLGLGPRRAPVTSARLATTVAGLRLPNPVGLAAGFDKDAEALPALLRVGFGFVEIGGVTPLPQAGNPKPRLFRLPEDNAVINRFGFNNRGAEALASRLALARPSGVVGLNIGANKGSEDRLADYAAVLSRLGDMVDFATVNVSSPNTEHLRDLQGPEALATLLNGVQLANGALRRPVPIFLKIAPDLGATEIDAIADIALSGGIAGIVATNTSLARPDLRSRQAGEAGGLSGRPLFEPSTRVLARLHRRLGGRLALIGVGGVASGADAYIKIRAGASAVQLYTALVYGGLDLVPRIVRELEALLDRDGFASVAEAVGTGAGEWLKSAV